MNKLIFELVGKLMDGTPIIVSDFVVDGECSVIDAAGVKAPIMDGEHELSSGDKFVTVGGKITEILVEEDKPAEVPVEQTVDVKQEMSQYVTVEMFNTLLAAFAEYSQEVEELKKTKVVEIKMEEVPSIMDTKIEVKPLTRKEHILMSLEKFK